MNVTVPVPRYTYEDYAHWKEDWELIDGYPYQLIPSTWNHSYIKAELSYQILAQLNTLVAETTHVFTALDWIIDNNTVFRPDLMIVCGEIKTNYLEFPPVLVIEIISHDL